MAHLGNPPSDKSYATGCINFIEKGNFSVCFLFLYVAPFVLSQKLKGTPKVYANIVLKPGEPLDLKDYGELVVLTNLTGDLHEHTFKNTPNIIQLIIDSSNIGSVHPKAFVPLTKLELFDAKQNTKFIGLTNDILKSLPSLKTLILLDKEVPEIDGLFNGLSNLVNLTYRHSKAPVLKKDYFKDLKKLEFIDLDFSEFKEVESGTFENLPELIEISLGSNSVEQFSEGAFKNLPKLKTIHIFRSKLKVITGKEFEKLELLEKLNLFDNNLESFDIKEVAARLPSLKIIRLEMNPLKCTEDFLSKNSVESKREIKITMDKNDGCPDDIPSKEISFEVTYNYKV